MTDDVEMTVWLNKLSEAPDQAMEKIWEGYFTKLVSYAHKKLGALPRRATDAEDIAAEALHSFYRRASDDRFPDLKDRHDLWKLLLTITARKAGKEIRGHLAQKRGGGAVRGESIFVNANGEGAGIAGEAEPTDQFAELFADELLQKLDSLDDERLKEIAIRKMEGYTNPEIAQQLDCALRTVERKLERIRNLWDEELG